MSAAQVLSIAEPVRAAQTHSIFVTLRLGGQLFGVPVTHVQDVIRKQRITPVPLAPSVVAGVLNLRGRIVTAIDMRKRLGLEPSTNTDKLMKIVVEHHHELFALMVDAVGDVQNLPNAAMEKPPANMDEAWRAVSTGVYKLEKELLVILDIENIVNV